MEASPFQLTFGVELECIVRYDPKIYKAELRAAEGKIWDTEPSPTLHGKYGFLVRRHMIEFLNRNGISTNSCQETGFSKWTVDTDGTVFPIDTTGSWYAIELISPVLFFSPASLKEVETVVELLASEFHLHVNESCGLHVHMGNENRGFNIRTLKSFCSMISVFEHQLNSLHPPHRLQNEHAKSTSRAFRAGATSGEKSSIIDTLGHVDDIILQFHLTDSNEMNKSMAFNFLNLSESYTDHPIQTIEFRQHEGTLDPISISSWVMVAASLLTKSNSDPAELRKLINKHGDDAKYTVIDLFRDLDLWDLADFYAPIVARQNAAPSSEGDKVFR